MKLAVHLHFYYLEQLSEILTYLRSLKGQCCDLFVTMVEENKKVQAQIKAVYPKAHIMVVPNCGYDLGPFIEFLHQIDLDKYDYVLKIHTKGNVSKNHTWLNGQRLDNKLWGHILWDALLKDGERVQNNLTLLKNNPQMGMLSSKYCITDEKRTYQKLLPQINEALKKCDFDETDKIRFVAGTMFYVQSKLLKPLLKYTIKDFNESNSTVKEGTFAHVVERVLGALMTAQGYSIYGIKHDNYTKGFVLASIKHFLYQKKKTQHRLLIKIFKVPVYSKKLEDK